MGKSFNNLSETSAGFVMLVSESGVHMDIKQLLLNEKARSMFKMEHVLYLMVINGTKSNRVNVESTFQQFIVENVKISRAYFYKVISAMVKSGMIDKLDKRGWYKVNHLKRQISEK